MKGIGHSVSEFDNRFQTSSLPGGEFSLGGEIRKSVENRAGTD
jgi:hypothetical protein